MVHPISKPGAPLLTSFAATLVLCAAAFAYGQDPTAVKQAGEDYRAGVAALSQNDLQSALHDFQEVVRITPNAEPGHLMLGFVLARLGRPKEAIPELEKALSLKPDDSDARMNLALAYEQIGAHPKAILQFSQAEAAAKAQGRSLPSQTLAAYARSLAATKQWNEATAKMQEAVAGDPQNAELHDECGTFFAEKKDWAKAQEQFNEAIHLKPGLAMAHLHLGIALAAVGESTALAEYQEAYRLAPQNAMIAVEVGKAFSLSGQDERAIPVLQHALELAPKSTAATYQLGLVYQRSGRLQDAVPLLQKVASAEPNNAGALTNLGLALCQTQHAKDAVPYLQKAVSLAPKDVTAREDLAAAYVTLGQYDDAIAQMRAALKLAPKDPRLHYNLGVAYKMQDDAANAIPELQAAERLDPTSPEPPFVLGMLYTQSGQFDDAARELSASLKLRPENGEGWSTLGTVYNSLGKLPEAASALREAIRQLPEQADPHLTLATVLAQQDRQTEAVAERKIAAELMRAHMNLQRAQVATNAGQSLLKGGNVSDAIVQFKDALSYDPKYLEAHLGLADALERQGNLMDAAAERQKASELKKLSESQ